MREGLPLYPNARNGLPPRVHRHLKPAAGNYRSTHIYLVI
ncbi:hypothetical protein HW555_004281 [Spodoptera exigua]|uniref:Uncharacterized protein n=1 Tax=Spodoptera exigua TaxID=7107 RepID=A0A835GK06_SPOEX|nr:hypothetical protein HW555_004281 [Spodoptera exigua]